MSGEGLSVSFRRTQMTAKSNQELLEEFQKIIYASPVTRHIMEVKSEELANN
jgi:hypothetical protein